MRRLGMFLADVILGSALAGALLPILLVKGVIESQAAFWTIVASCIAAVAVLHGTFHPPKRQG